MQTILPPLIVKGIDCIELHAMGTDEEEIFSKWNTINNLYSGILSICIGRGNIGDKTLLTRIKKMLANRTPYSTIIQADGFPMSGGKDDYKTTLQAVAAAEIVQNENLPVYIMLSGGTNSKTAELAQLCNINFNGIAIGSYARKIVQNEVGRNDFLTNDRIFKSALSKAETLINSTILT